METDWTGFSRDILQQAWAEGYDIQPWLRRASNPSEPMSLLGTLSSLPRRPAAHYQANTSFPVGSLFVARRIQSEQLISGIRGLWTGALRTLRALSLPDDEAGLSNEAHWPLNLLIGRTGWSYEPDQFLQVWVQHGTEVQHTRAEQYLWQGNQRPLWHPYREASGAMRRAPLWGALYAGTPDQAGWAAARDAQTTYVGWGVWTSMVVAQAAARLFTDRLPLAVVFMQTAEQFSVHQPNLAEMLAVCQATYEDERPWEEWVRHLEATFSFYPFDHSLPNFLIIAGSLLWYQRNHDTVFRALRQAGWDTTGNSLVVGALQGCANGGHGLSDRTNPFLDAVVSKTLSWNHPGSRL